MQMKFNLLLCPTYCVTNRNMQLINLISFLECDTIYLVNGMLLRKSLTFTKKNPSLKSHTKENVSLIKSKFEPTTIPYELEI